MAQYATLQQKSFVRGLNASTDIFNQPRGSFPRGSNLVLSKRGALKACDGSAIVHAFTGVPIAGRGRIMSSILFQPIGVPPYYMLLGKATDLHLGFPRNVSAALVAGGTLAAGVQLFYQVTALDGAGGETNVIGEVTATPAGGNLSVKLTWNIVPNAKAYNVYRSTVSMNEQLLVGSATAPLPVPQPATATVTFTDDGSTTFLPATVAIAAAPNGLVALGNGTVQVTSTAALPSMSFGQAVSISGAGPVGFNSIAYQVITPVPTGSKVMFLSNPNNVAAGTTGGGGTAALVATVPTLDTTQQTALYAVPSSSFGTPNYDNSNVVALFPADLPIDGWPRGGVGGGGAGGGTGGGGNAPGGGGSQGPGGSTASGGILNNISNIPQMVQFVNRIAIALGNGFPPQLYTDATGTTDTGATKVPITAISVDANGIVSVTVGGGGHGLLASQVGANVLVQGVTNIGYNSAPSAHVTLTIPDNTHVTYRDINAIGAAASSGGTLTVGAAPFISTFTAAYPTWQASITHLVGDIVQPAAPNGHFYKYVQGGISGTVAPTFPTVSGAQVADGSAILKEAGVTSSAPAPPGAAHLAVFAGSLWVWNTSPTNTANGLDGPTVLRMSDVNNPNSWNPINQAFLDKDDGTDGMGLASFTITAQGIPPEGSLIACKDFATYQILGVFGAPNFAIQRIKSDMGCIAPRTLQFVPGFGIARYSHLGFAVFDGVDDKLISEDIRPYLFPTNDPDYADISVVDANWIGVAWAAQVSNPPMYSVAMPIGNSSGALTRIFSYDLVLKAWTAPVDLPFPISNLYQARTEASNPITLMGSFSDGTFQRWQAADLQWATSASGSATPAPVAWSITSPEVFNQFPLAPQTGPLFYHQLIVRGRAVDPALVLSVSLNLQEEGATPAFVNQYNFGVQGAFELVIPISETLINARAIVSGVGAAEIDSFEWFVAPKPSLMPVRVT